MKSKPTDNPTIAMISPPFALHREFIDYPYFADLGMLLNASACVDAGLNVQVFDALAQPHTGLLPVDLDRLWMGCRAERLDQWLNDARPDIAVVCGNPFVDVRIRRQWMTALLENIHAANPDCVIVYADCYIGGMHYVDVHPDVIRQNHPRIRHIVKYHSEARLPSLLRLLAANPGAPPATLYGASRELNLDALPNPAWDRISIENHSRYLSLFFHELGRPSLFRLEGRVLPAVFSRGCAFKCSFCTANPAEKSPRHIRMSRARILDLLNEYKNRWSCRRVAFLDGLANPSRRAFDELLNVMDETALDYDFLNGLRADRLSRAQLSRMKDRVTLLSISAESADPDILERSIGKTAVPGAVEQVASWCAEIGIPLLIHYIVGFPGESIQSAQRTFTHAAQMKSTHGASPSVQFATPFPGTRLYDFCASNNLLPPGEPDDYSPYFSSGGLIALPEKRLADLRRAHDNWRRSLDAGTLQKAIVNLTYICDNKCEFCAVGDRPRIHAEPSDIAAAIRAYRKKGARLLDLDGGEPTLYPQLFEAVAAARSAGYERVSLTTNGRRLADDSFARRLLCSGLTDLLVSLYGHTASLHEAHTLAPGSFDQTVAGIRNAVRHKPKSLNLAVNTAVTSRNVRYIPRIAAFVLDLGVSTLNIQMLTPFGSANAAHVPDIKLASASVLKAVDSTKGKLDIRVINAPPCLFPGCEDLVAADAFKRARDMVFIGDKGTNLADYLASRRKKLKKCEACVHALVCDGFYDFKPDAPKQKPRKTTR